MSLIFMALALTNLMSGGIKRTDTSTTLDSLTIVYALQTLSLVLQVIAGIILVLRRLKHSPPSQRVQIWLFVFGMITAIIIGSLPGFVFIIFDIESKATTFLSGISFFVFGLCVLIAITRHKLFNVRSIVARSIAYFFSLIIVATVYALLVGLVIERLTQSKVIEVLLTGVSALIAMTLFRYIRNGFDRITNRLFYREAYSSREKLDMLTDGLMSQTELKELAKVSLASLQKTLLPQKAALLILNKRKPFLFGDNFGSGVYSRIQKPSETATAYIYEVDELSGNSFDISMRSYGIALIVPLRSVKQLEGYIILGPRSSGSVYTRQDINFLKISARNIALAISNAKSYLEISDFNKTLKAKIADATKQLRRKNGELERLHKTKDDFISMASHQLRPKITASAGFLDLMDNTKPAFSADQAELLGLAKQGLKQMTEIISDMLDISRMDSGGITLDTTKTDIIALAAEEVKRANMAGSTARIHLVNGLKSKSYAVELDRLKIREVIKNLLDNALQYSKDEIVMHLFPGDNKFIELMVRDSGIGLTRSEQARLFEKFYRSDGAKKLRPNGSGIGLYAAKLIVEAHGGSMIVKAKKGEGTTIGFRLPG